MLPPFVTYNTFPGAVDDKRFEQVCRLSATNSSRAAQWSCKACDAAASDGCISDVQSLSGKAKSVCGKPSADCLV